MLDQKQIQRLDSSIDSMPKINEQEPQSPLKALQKQTKISNKKIIILALEIFAIFLLVTYDIEDEQQKYFDPSNYNETEISDFLISGLMYRSLTSNQIRKRPFTSKAFFAYRLALNDKDPVYHRLEYNYYKKYYKIDQYQYQLPICIVSPGRNLYSRGRYYQKYFESLQAQNYSNFKVIIIDDMSDDNSSQKIKEFLNENTIRLKDKVQVIANTERKYSLANKDYAIRQLCAEGDIIFDIDADDFLIGRQAMKLINAVYQANPQFWVVHANDISFQENLLQPLISQSHMIPEQIFKEKAIRKYIFAITNPRTFRRQLYTTIDPKQFINPKTGQFWRWTSDRFIYNALLELAGFKHTHYIDENIYFYNNDQILNFTSEKLQCSIQGRLQTPFLPLEDYRGAKAVRDSQYNLTQEQIQSQTEKAQRYYLKALTINTYTEEQQHIIHRYLQKMKKKAPHIQNISKYRDNIQSGDILIANEIVENSLYLQFHSVQNFQMQEIYQQKIAKRSAENQLNFCILGNVQTRRDFIYLYRFLISIAIQHYVNYNVVLTFDIEITTEQKKSFKHYLQQNYPYMLQRIIFVYNQKTKGIAWNRHEAILNYCSQNSYVIPLPINGQIIGMYFLQLFNYLHQEGSNKTNSFIYANQIQFQIVDTQFQLKNLYGGGSIETFPNPFALEDHIVTQKNKKIWLDFYPFSFDRQLYNNINLSQVCFNEKQEKQDCQNRFIDSFLFKIGLDRSKDSYLFQNRFMFSREYTPIQFQQQNELIILNQTEFDSIEVD